jgi:hypothetical protein
MLSSRLPNSDPYDFNGQVNQQIIKKTTKASTMDLFDILIRDQNANFELNGGSSNSTDLSIYQVNSISL